MKETKINQFSFMSLHEIKCHFVKKDFHKNEFSMLHIVILKFASLEYRFEVILLQESKNCYSKNILVSQLKSNIYSLKNNINKNASFILHIVKIY